MENEFRPLFENDSLKGWKVYPRGLSTMQPGSEREKLAWQHPGQWCMKDGVLEGRQDPPGCGLGSYLVSEEEFGDFELCYEAKPDWPADTGIYVRADVYGSLGYQILLDHRKSGSIGGFYGNGMGGFHAINWNVDADLDENGKALQIKIEDPATTLEPISPDKPALLSYKISGEEFMKLWKWNDWNAFRVTCKGLLPTLTTYINDVKVASIDMAKVESPRFNREAALKLGSKGHISFEVHDNDPKMGWARWGKDAACRFRNVRIRLL